METEVFDVVPFLKPMGICYHHGAYRRKPFPIDGINFYFQDCDKCSDDARPEEDVIKKIRDYIGV